MLAQPMINAFYYDESNQISKVKFTLQIMQIQTYKDYREAE